MKTNNSILSGPRQSERVRVVRAWLPQMELVVIDGADHAMSERMPAEVAAAIIEFIARHAMREPLARAAG